MWGSFKVTEIDLSVMCDSC